MSSNRYICAAVGRRDAYQVPVALVEAGLLEMLVTDMYCTRSLRFLATCLPAKLRRVVRGRYHPDLPQEKVRSLSARTALCCLRGMMQGNLDAAAGRLDVLCGQLAARYAQRCPSHLLLYHSYAWEAFRADYHHKPRKVLFQYHPHGLLEESILRQDAMGTGNTLPRLRSTTEREREVWRYADLVLCASSFTKHSLVSAGMDPKRCRVVPYGVEPPSPEPSLTAWKPGRFLFVGSGVRRKGLHHLLSAWQAATLPPECELLLVCREMEPALRTLAKATRQVRVVNGASATELSDFFASSMAFVMPSLCEGFGHVYAEALNYGCPILGTPNSCVPDLGGEQDGVFCVPAGNIKELRLALERLALMLPNRPDLREAALRKGAKLTWRRFRAGVVECLSDF